MRKLLVTALLITAMTCTAYAGVIQNGGPGEPPSGEPGVIQNGSPDGTSNSAGEVMQNGVATTSDAQAIEFTLGLLQSMLPALF